MSLTLVQRRGDREGQRFEREEFLAKILETSKGYSQRKHIALIGEPGAGKTTLLQTIAFRILDNHLGLPIWISLADLKKSDNKFQQLDDYLESRWLKQADTKMRLTSAMKVEFWKQWEKEKVWLFLDGVDEVATDNYSDLQNFFDWLPGSTANARVILTCRLNVWEAHINNWKFHEDWLDFDRWKFYQNWFNCDAYQLLDLIYPQQVKQFIDNGFNQPNLLAAPNANSLWEELQSHKDKWLNNLVKNPLRLALLCGSWQGEELSFPKTKAGLYKRFLEAFYTCKQKF
ncbi:MAG: NACHT domain-containing protein, partial [Cyanobacteriota bacterium]|nr:NACHT domain-containing protein [Cyanobacteriota bacterium]